ncbi:MAG: holo-ACP synthase [Holosporales bacterium]|nr:holo-ACP synthase [Holosporales bacterium]
MIVGIGIDILDIRRIERLVLKFPEKFETRICTRREIEFCRARTQYIESLSKMFSMKEAVLKAISNVSGIRWHDIEILHDSRGKPSVNLSGVALRNLTEKSETFQLEVSTSDEPPYVVSFVVIYSRNSINT